MMFRKIVAFKSSRMVLFTGGTAANSFTAELHEKTHNLTYIIPISDNGGSTGIIQEFIGGPAIGDIRSRLVRLAQNSPIEELLKYRLPSSKSGKKAFNEWQDILFMKHKLWEKIPKKYRDIIKANLNTFNATLQTNVHCNRQFNFSDGSIGNFFFSGARLHYGSLSATIFLFKHILGIQDETNVMPVIDINKRITIGVELEDGTKIQGQNEVSHPTQKDSNDTHVNKHDTTAMPAKIKRIEYVDKDKKTYNPTLNEDVEIDLSEAGTIVYSMGSFYTSLLPNLIIKGVGESIKNSNAKKVLIVNGSYDRETTYLDKDGNIKRLSLKEQLEQLKVALNRYGELNNELSDYVTDIIVLEGGEIQPTEDAILKGITIHTIKAERDNITHYNPEELSKTLISINQ